jgi:hypothetical protein
MGLQGEWRRGVVASESRRPGVKYSCNCTVVYYESVKFVYYESINKLLVSTGLCSLSSHLKAKVVNILTKVEVLLVNLNIGGTRIGSPQCCETCRSIDLSFLSFITPILIHRSSIQLSFYRLITNKLTLKKPTKHTKCRGKLGVCLMSAKKH